MPTVNSAFPESKESPLQIQVDKAIHPRGLTRIRLKGERSSFSDDYSAYGENDRDSARSSFLFSTFFIVSEDVSFFLQDHLQRAHCTMSLTMQTCKTWTQLLILVPRMMCGQTMAENAVHLTSIEHARPTIFEIWAEESFMASLQPAFQLLCDFLRSKIPGAESGPLRIIFKWPDETFLIFNIIMQSTYLDWFNASFSESFYGMKRVNAKAPSEPLTTKAKIISLMGLVGAPYVMAKFKAIADKYLYSSQETATGLKILERYKTVSTLLRLIKLYYYVSYLSGSNVNHSVFHRLAGVQLVQQNQPSPSWSDVWSLIRHEPNRMKLLGPLAFKVISQLFEFGAFSLQFINWWNSSESETLKFNKNPIPEPIEPISTNKSCPICKKPWRLEVALATSGIVYCYSCITRVLAESGLCPVTGLPFTMEDLIRLYPSAS